MITRHPIVVEFFSSLQFRSKLLSLAIIGRDLLGGLDITKKVKDRLEIRTKGIAFREHFKPNTTTSKLFHFSDEDINFGKLTSISMIGSH